jgi:hypothetical protein
MNYYSLIFVNDGNTGILVIHYKIPIFLKTHFFHIYIKSKLIFCYKYVRFAYCGQLIS